MIFRGLYILLLKPVSIQSHLFRVRGYGFKTHFSMAMVNKILDKFVQQSHQTLKVTVFLAGSNAIEEATPIPLGEVI